MKKAISYLVIFLGIQILGGAVINTLWSIITKSSDRTAALIITLTAVVSIITILVFLLARWTAVSPNLAPRRRLSKSSHQPPNAAIYLGASP